MGTIRICRSFSLLSLVILGLQIVQMECFNLETRLPMVKEGPLLSRFGLSLAEHRLTKTRASFRDGYNGSLVLVGAPKYDDPTGPVPMTGAVFKCPMTTYVDDCEDLMLDKDANTPEENKTDQWLGVTVRSLGAGGKVSACAHRYKEISDQEISGKGKCLLMNADLSEDDYRGAWKMCPTIQGKIGKSGNSYCQAGTGFFITEEGQGMYVSGNPGTGDWRGGITIGTIPSDENFYQVDTIRTTLSDSSTGVGLNSYLGFSVTSGRFGSEFMVASGAPRHNAIGAVVMLAIQGRALMMESVIRGEQLTESFGYEVCAADLDGDGFDDLLVGAPIYYDRNTEAGGRVYVYLNKHQNGNFTDIKPIRLTGPIDSMFGISIINLGDLNLDGYEDVAIGAPYENKGEGAVYVYLGSGKEGIEMHESQKLTPADLPLDLPTTREIKGGFGYSLSGGVDLDGNEYPDLSIGVLEADATVTYRARPIINITAELLLQETQLAANSTNFEYNGQPTFRFYVQARMQYVCNAFDFDSPIRVEYSIEAEEERRNLNRNSRVIFEKSNSFAIRDETMTLRPQSDEAPKRSPKFWAVLRPGFTDIFRKIPFKLTYKLVEIEAETPAPGDDLPNMDDYPILNSLHDPSYVSELDFIKACAQDDGKCITDLDLDATLSLEGDPPVLRVGNFKDLFVDIVIINREEPAYDATLTITFPEVLGFSKIEDDASQNIRTGCGLMEDNATVILCKLGNPYPELAVERFTIKFDASEIPPEVNNFTIRMDATATNEDMHPEDNHVDLFVDVESITDIQISVSTPIRRYSFRGDILGESAMEYTDDIGAEVVYTWLVVNTEPGIILESLVTISFPYEIANGKWLQYMTHAPFISPEKGRCEVDPIYINELNLKERPIEAGPSYEEVSTTAPGVAEAPPSPSDVPGGGAATPSKGRRRRDAGEEDVARPQKRSSGQAEAQKEKKVQLDCFNGRANCFDIKCYLEPMGKDEEVEIVLRSRLWNSTFLEDFIHAAEVKVVSSGKVEILNAPYTIEYNLDNDASNMSVYVSPGIEILPPPEPLAWWIILLAVLAGLIILILLILILWKVGFFRRPGRRGSGGGGGGGGGCGSCGFFERKSMAYKYATVTQKKPGGNAATEKTAYYDEKYFT